MTTTVLSNSIPMMASARKWSPPADAKLARWLALRPARPCANALVNGARMGRNRLNGHRCCFASARLAVCGVKTS